MTFKFLQVDTDVPLPNTIVCWKLGSDVMLISLVGELAMISADVVLYVG